jgi:hypothetical protein
MDLSIIIVNWNSADYAAQCVSSIYSQTKNLEYEVIIVDNASTDESCRVFQERLPRLKLIRNAENLGFAKANNLGFEYSNGRNLLFLNPDTDLRMPAINLMHSCLESSPSVGILGCKLLNTDLTIQTTCIQSYPTILNQMIDIDRLRRLFPRWKLWSMRPLFEENHGLPVEVDMVCGACLMVKRQVFQKVGRFDPDYFMYTEDLDLCYRVKSAGWKVCYLGSATIVHHGGQSSKKKGGEAFSSPMIRETLLTFFEKTRGPIYARLYRLAMLMVAVVRVSILAALLIVAALGFDKDSIRFSFRKWYKILRWSVGLEAWTRQMGKPAASHAAGS